MTKYEYTIVTLSTSCEAALNALGAEGWIVVCGGPPYEGWDMKEHLHVILMRPKPSAAEHCATAMAEQDENYRQAMERLIAWGERQKATHERVPLPEAKP